MESMMELTEYLITTIAKNLGKETVIYNEKEIQLFLAVFANSIP